jgi:site-specific DNA-methyltransferase (adenine-specific)
MSKEAFLEVDEIHQGDARELVKLIEPESIALSVWSPPYHVGKSYEEDMTFEDWRSLLSEVIAAHFVPLKPGGFLAINIADILAFKDPSMPRIQALNPALRKHAITKEDVLAAKAKNPTFNRDQLAELLGVSEQTIDRRLNGNNIRGGKHSVQTRVRIVGGIIEEMALNAGFFTYDRRIWAKDPAWRNSRWAKSSYRSVDEFEYIYIFWKPGITTVDRGKLTDAEWSEWGSRGVWSFPSVRSNNIHEAMFPMELPKRCMRLLAAPGETVLDCFMGSGTTALAALETGRRYIGIEFQQEYVDLARALVASRSYS